MQHKITVLTVILSLSASAGVIASDNHWSRDEFRNPGNRPADPRNIPEWINNIRPELLEVLSPEDLADICEMHSKSLRGKGLRPTPKKNAALPKIPPVDPIKIKIDPIKIEPQPEAKVNAPPKIKKLAPAPKVFEIPKSEKVVKPTAKKGVVTAPKKVTKPAAPKKK